MPYDGSRPVIVRTLYKDRRTHYVMTAKEATAAVQRAMQSREVIGVEITPVDHVSPGMKRTAPVSETVVARGATPARNDW